MQSPQLVLVLFLGLCFSQEATKILYLFGHELAVERGDETGINSIGFVMGAPEPKSACRGFHQGTKGAVADTKVP